MWNTIQAIFTALGSVVRIVLGTFPAACLFGLLGLLVGYTLVTTPPFSYLCNVRLIILLGLVGLGAGLWLDWRRR